MFEFNTHIKLYDADAAGILFFANQFRIVHEAYEAFLEKIGFPVKRILEKESYLFPVVSAGTEYKLPLRTGDKVRVQIGVSTVGKTSVTLKHTLLNEQQLLAGIGETVHVCISKLTGEKTDIPKKFKDALIPFIIES